METTNNSKLIVWTMRPYDPSIDEAFLYSTYLRSFQQSSFARAISLDLYNRGARKRLDRLLEDPQNYCIVASDPDVREMIYGWSLWGGDNILHYIYVKFPYRRQGIGSSLVQAINGENDALIYTHKGSEIWQEKKIKEDHKMLQWFYDPFLLDKGSNNE